MSERGNKKIIIDAGHGGEDIGYNDTNIIEKDFTLELSKYIYDKLKNQNIEVILTRDNDITLSPSDRTNKILNTYGNNSDVIVLSNQLATNGENTTDIVYALRNNDELPNLIREELENSDIIVGKVYQLRSASDTSKDYYFIHRDTGNTQAIMVEYYIADSSNWKNQIPIFGDAVAEALLEYVGKPTDDNYYVVVSGDKVFMGNKCLSN